MKMWMQFNVMPWTSLGVDAVYRHAQDVVYFYDLSKVLQGCGIPPYFGVTGVLDIDARFLSNYSFDCIKTKRL